MWNGQIVFWESLSVQTKKKAQFYNKQKADPFSRLRVPRYIKTVEVLFFASFLALYYAVLVERNPYKMTVSEILLYVWVAAFAYDELTEFVDAGLFYYTDFWSSWDLAIIIVGVAFLITRIIGLWQVNDETVDIAFDILSLEALFLIPRICSLLSLHPYFGTLIPCLKEMTKDFFKFMVVVAILYVGFLTTFSMLARDHFTLSQMSWILIKVFFGSSYIGFDIMHDISPQLGPPLMLIFVTLTQILLITSLISILSNSFSRVTSHAREEYLFVYSVYVLEVRWRHSEVFKFLLNVATGLNKQSTHTFLPTPEPDPANAHSTATHICWSRTASRNAHSPFENHAHPYSCSNHALRVPLDQPQQQHISCAWTVGKYDVQDATTFLD